MIVYVARGIVLSLAWFTLVNVVSSALVAAIAGPLTRSSLRSPVLWLGLRLLPALASTAFVLAVFVPSYWQFEPRGFVEGFDLTLTICATAGIAIVAAAVARGMAAARAADRRVQQWMRGARPLSIDDSSIAAYEIDCAQPVIALAGLFSPRLLVSRRLTSALSPAELSASIAHEIEHRRAFDNLKRLAIRSAPDVLGWSSAARSIERRWMSAAEHTADRMAVAGAEARCALASALVKVARLTPAGPLPAEPISTLIGGGEIASRVRELLEDRPMSKPRAGAILGAAAVAAGAAVAIQYTPILRGVHEVTEVLVHSLP
jgi:beta-lactamase regulating signal transducer with metallopeptidase domain